MVWCTFNVCRLSFSQQTDSVRGYCVPFLVCYLNLVLCGLKNGLVGFNKTKMMNTTCEIKDSNLKPSEFAPATPVYKLINRVIKATNENHDRYHYKTTGVLSPFPSASERIKATKLMFTPIMLQKHRRPLSSSYSPLRVRSHLN